MKSIASFRCSEVKIELGSVQLSNCCSIDVDDVIRFYVRVS